MKVVFADTFYFLALSHSNEKKHRLAVEYSRSNSLSLVTTAWVLLEVADGMSRSHSRYLFQELYRSLVNNPSCRIMPPDQSTFKAGLDLFFQRPDKAWSLTDCLSFVVMKEEGIQEALTGDHHFAQAGFVALLE